MSDERRQPLLATMPLDLGGAKEIAKIDPVSERRCGEGGDRHVRATVLETSEAHRMDPDGLGRLSLGHAALCTEFPKSQAEAPLLFPDRIRDALSAVDLGAAVVERRRARHATGVRDGGWKLHSSRAKLTGQGVPK